MVCMCVCVGIKIFVYTKDENEQQTSQSDGITTAQNIPIDWKTNLNLFEFTQQKPEGNFAQVDSIY